MFNCSGISFVVLEFQIHLLHQPDTMPAAQTAKPANKPLMPPTQRIVQAVTGAIGQRRLMPGTKLTEQKWLYDVLCGY